MWVVQADAPKCFCKGEPSSGFVADVESEVGYAAVMITSCSFLALKGVLIA